MINALSPEKSSEMENFPLHALVSEESGLSKNTGKRRKNLLCPGKEEIWPRLCRQPPGSPCVFIAGSGDLQGGMRKMVPRVAGRNIRISVAPVYNL